MTNINCKSTIKTFYICDTHTIPRVIYYIIKTRKFTLVYITKSPTLQVLFRFHHLLNALICRVGSTNLCVLLWHFITHRDSHSHHHIQNMKLFLHHKRILLGYHLILTLTPSCLPNPWKPLVCSSSLYLSFYKCYMNEIIP